VVQLRLKKVDSSAATDVDEIVQLLTAANQRAREMARGMVPVVLDSAGLMAALNELAQTTQQIFDLEIAFNCDPPVEVADNQVATQLYRIAQEGISNAVKHSQATKVELTLSADAHGLLLVIEDNGNGLPEGRSGMVTGMGLLTMSRRARMVGGELSVANHPLGGTIVTCSIPIPHPSLPTSAETA
jgi:signal transduction histidine kinase